MRMRGAAGSLVLVLALAACGSADRPSPAGEGNVPPTSATTTAPVPPDGLPLAAFGFASGPLDTFSLPRGTRLKAAVDQPDNVTVVLAAPAPPTVVAYLRRTLPAAGFTLTDDPGGTTLTFRGHGWTGSVTSGGGTTAVLLRPI
jgi:hypothetical protein